MKRHSTDLVSLAFGLIFAGIAGFWLIGRYLLDVHLNIPNLGLIMAAALIVLGLLGVVGSLRRERKPNNATAGEPTAAPAAMNVPMDTVAETGELADPVPPTERDDRPY